MEKTEFAQLYKIDEVRLRGYYDRIKKQFSDREPIEIVAKFLNNQSIGTSITEITQVLSHYQKKLTQGNDILKLAFEWIRANEIRLKYKKYLIMAKYPHGDLALAIDDCISRLFLDYDEYIRTIFHDIAEHEISTLYQIFFSPFETKNFQFENILEWQQDKVPTIMEGYKRIDTRITTLRSGLSQLIIMDYEDVILSRKKEKEIKEFKVTKKSEVIKKSIGEFSGALLERMIKSYSISKNKISSKELENAITQFLGSYFKFGAFYKYDDFKVILIQSFAEDIMAGLTEKLKKSYNLSELKISIVKVLEEFREINQIKELDGSAWKNDLMQYLKKFLANFLEHVFEPKETAGPIAVREVTEPETVIEEPKFQEIKATKPDDEVDFSALFDLNMEIEEYRQKLEESLEHSDLSAIKKLGLIRSKVHEFTMEKRRQMRTPR